MRNIAENKQVAGPRNTRNPQGNNTTVTAVSNSETPPPPLEDTSKLNVGGVNENSVHIFLFFLPLRQTSETIQKTE